MGRRSQVLLGTKVGNRWREDDSGWDWNPGKEYIIRAAEKCLRQQGTDWIVLYQLHGRTTQDPIEETIDAFETLKRRGEILYIGIFSIRPNVIREYLAKSSIENLMCQYGIAD